MKHWLCRLFGHKFDPDAAVYYNVYYCERCRREYIDCEPGWYWYTGRGWSSSICIEVFQDKHKWIASEFRGDRSTWQDLENMDGRWAGPILEPAF